MQTEISRPRPVHRISEPPERTDNALLLERIGFAASRCLRALGSGTSGRAGAFETDQLLVLLSYCYARRIYSSAVIAGLLRREPGLSRLCPEGLPDERELRTFRDGNRQSVHCCLKTALRCQAENKQRDGVVTRLNDAQLEAEAHRRMINAVFLDSTGVEGSEAGGASVDLGYLVANGSRAVH